MICQNPVLRVLNGAFANVGVHQDRSGVQDGDAINLNTQAEQDDWFAILNRAQLAYQLVFEPLSFSQGLRRPAFPLGRKSSLRATRDQPRRIEPSIRTSCPSGWPSWSPRAFRTAIR